MHMQKDTRILFSSFDMDSNTKILYLTTSFLICMITFKGKLLNKTSIKIPWDMKLQAGIHLTFSNLFKLILKNTLLWSFFSTILTVYRLTCNEDCFKDRERCLEIRLVGAVGSGRTIFRFQFEFIRKLLYDMKNWTNIMTQVMWIAE